MSVKSLKRKTRILLSVCAGVFVPVSCLVLCLANRPVLLRYEQADISFEAEGGRITRITIDGCFPYGVVYGRPVETEGTAENGAGGTDTETYVMEADFSLFMKSSMNLDLESEGSARTVVFRFADRELVVTDGKVVKEL